MTFTTWITARLPWLLPVTIAGAILSGCSAVAPVRVLNHGTDAITASIGGAVVPNTSPTGVVPYLTAGYAYGLTENVTVQGRAHLLMAVFGVAGIDLGASMRAIPQDGLVPEVTLGAQLIGFASLARSAPARIYPNLTANASWSLGEQSLIYAGTHATIQPDPMTTFISPFVGYQFPVSNRMRLQVETIWQASTTATEHGVFEGASSIGGTGSFGIYLGGMLSL
ncbi:MAG: hypothetical protein FGM32_10215 [Candidatus Kapabacteria bacterium]|nr:hypothetical protein [Candidatus Kapabacteria bacterium]